MPELSLSTLLLSHFFHFCFFLLSHPLYFSYFIFFFPYLLKLFSFLSPLFFTTFLLLLAFFHGLVHQDQDNSRLEFSDTQLGFLSTALRGVSGRFRPRICQESEEFRRFEELEFYNVVFQTCGFETRETPDDAIEVEVKMDCSSLSGSAIGGKKPTHGVEKLILPPIQEADESDRNQTGSESEQEKKEGESDALHMTKKRETETQRREGSESEKADVGEKQTEQKPETVETKDGEEKDSLRPEMKLASFGSARKTAEWRRGLACKLFEARCDVAGGGEEMDLLWETYETKSAGKVAAGSNSKKDLKSWVNQNEEDDEEEGGGKICCLQALKLSTGKMRFGMGRRSSLKKISRAFKGIKLLDQLSRNSGKKRGS